MYLRRPSLAMRVAVLTFLVVVGIPLLILFGFAAVVAAAVFGGLALLGAAGRRIKATLPVGKPFERRTPR